MSERVAPNLPSRDYETTVKFFEPLGFSVRFRSDPPADAWLVMLRGKIALEFYYAPATDPLSTAGMCSIYTDRIVELYSAFSATGLTHNRTATPRLHPVEGAAGSRAFALIDPDGNLLRCMETK